LKPRIADRLLGDDAGVDGADSTPRTPGRRVGACGREEKAGDIVSNEIALRVIGPRVTLRPFRETRRLLGDMDQKGGRESPEELIETLHCMQYREATGRYRHVTRRARDAAVCYVYADH